MAGPAIMTYSTLLAQLESYLNRDDQSTIDMLPYFVYQAEQRICRESKAVLLESYVVGAFIVGQSVYQKPAGWRRSLSWNWGSGTGDNTRNQLYLRSYEFCRAYWPTSTDVDDPLYYADYSYANFLVAPTPSAASPFELCYLQIPTPLSSSNETNNLTNYCPDLLLYACLLETATFLKDDERIATWEQYYNRALQSFNLQDDQRVTDRSSNRGSD